MKTLYQTMSDYFKKKSYGLELLLKRIRTS